MAACFFAQVEAHVKGRKYRFRLTLAEAKLKRGADPFAEDADDSSDDGAEEETGDVPDMDDDLKEFYPVDDDEEEEEEGPGADAQMDNDGDDQKSSAVAIAAAADKLPRKRKRDDPARAAAAAASAEVASAPKKGQHSKKHTAAWSLSSSHVSSSTGGAGAGQSRKSRKT